MRIVLRPEMYRPLWGKYQNGTTHIEYTWRPNPRSWNERWQMFS